MPLDFAVTLPRPAERMAERRHVTMWQALCWTYAIQRAHILLGNRNTMASRIAWFEWHIAATTPDPYAERPKVCHDAAALHDAVLRLGPANADVLILHAARCEQPEPPTTLPQPHPVPLSRLEAYREARRGQGYSNGRAINYVIATHETVAVEQPVYENRRRGVRRQIGTELVQKPVEYCPLDWSPDPAFYESEAATHARWVKAMARLWVRRRSIELDRHTISGHGVEHVRPMELTRQQPNAHLRALKAEFDRDRVDVEVGQARRQRIFPAVPGEVALIVRARAARRPRAGA